MRLFIRTQLELIKEVAPEVPIPEIDAAKPVLDEVSEVRAELDAVKTAQDAEEARRMPPGGRGRRTQSP